MLPGIVIGATLLGNAGAFLTSPPRIHQSCAFLSSKAGWGRARHSMPKMSTSPSTSAISDDPQKVLLRVYDIGGPYTKLLSMALRKEMPGIWHVGIGVFEKEYWFSTKIEQKALSETETAFGMAPIASHEMGQAVVNREEFERFLEETLTERFNRQTYKVFEHNCNHFAEASVAFLTGGEVRMPDYILENSDNALSAMPKGQAILTRMVADQVAKIVMFAWGSANQKKEDRAKRAAKVEGLVATQVEKTRDKEKQLVGAGGAREALGA